jgi:hypothetical protein
MGPAAAFAAGRGTGNVRVPMDGTMAVMRRPADSARTGRGTVGDCSRGSPGAAGTGRQA